MCKARTFPHPLHVQHLLASTYMYVYDVYVHSLIFNICDLTQHLSGYGANSSTVPHILTGGWEVELSSWGSWGSRPPSFHAFRL